VDQNTAAKIYSRVLTPPEHEDEYYFSEGLRSQLARARILCAQVQPLIVFNGSPGSGRSTLARWFYEHSSSDQHDVVLVSIFRRQREAGWLLPRIAEFFGLAVPEQETTASLLQPVCQKLEELITEKRSLVIVIDAGEKLEHQNALQELHGLLHLQSISGHCLSVILLGGDRLNQLVQSNKDLAPYVCYRGDINPLGAADVATFLKKSFAKVPNEEFSMPDDLAPLLCGISQGNFTRLVNLVEACCLEVRLQQKPFNRDIIDAVAENLGYQASSEPKPARQRPKEKDLRPAIHAVQPETGPAAITPTTTKTVDPAKTSLSDLFQDDETPSRS